MRVSQIKLSNFRNHAESTFEFGDGINVLLGDNGQGKTNVLEAISYLSLTKSFYAANDAHAVRIGTAGFDLEGSVITGGAISSSIRVGYVRDSGEKTFLINGVRPETLAEVIGRFPVVILSPENNAITFGGPVERRKFMDLTLSQVSPVYLGDLMEYRRILRQRNRILADAKYEGRRTTGIIEPWDENLVRYGSRIIYRRRQFAGEFRTYVERAYRDLAGGTETPELAYVSLDHAGDRIEDTAACMQEELTRRRKDEEQRGTTLVGPHRDELRLAINGIGIQQYASQGQHKTMLVALKIAEFHYLSERRNETPVFLLDDVFSELDEHRSAHIVAMAGSLGQTVITTTDERLLRGVVDWNGHHRRFYIEQGASRPAPQTSAQRQEPPDGDR